MTELKPISGLYAIEVPSMAFGIMINNYGNKSELMYTLSMEDISDSEDDTEETLITKKLTPPGSYEILFTTKEADEKKLRNLVDVAVRMKDHERLIKTGWWNYEGGKSLKTATESLQSLLRANGLPTDKNYLLIKSTPKKQ